MWLNWHLMVATVVKKPLLFFKKRRKLERIIERRYKKKEITEQKLPQSQNHTLVLCADEQNSIQIQSPSQFFQFPSHLILICYIDGRGTPISLYLSRMLRKLLCQLLPLFSWDTCQDRRLNICPCTDTFTDRGDQKFFFQLASCKNSKYSHTYYEQEPKQVLPTSSEQETFHS